MKLLYVILLCSFICSASYSQQDSSNSKYALSFGIKDILRLTNFDMDIAVKKIIDSSHQLRLFLSPNITRNKSEDNRTENISQNYSIGIGSDYLCTLMKEEDISMYGGSGLNFRYRYSSTKTTSKNENDVIIHETINPTTLIGIRGILGVEWKVSNRIGIHSEYLLEGSYSWGEVKTNTSVNNINDPTVETKVNIISLGSRVLFGVSIYL